MYSLQQDAGTLVTKVSHSCVHLPSLVPLSPVPCYLHHAGDCGDTKAPGVNTAVLRHCQMRQTTNLREVFTVPGEDHPSKIDN